MYQLEHSNFFVIRAIFKLHPFKFVTFALISGIVFFGFSIRILEAPLSRNVNDMSHWEYSNCLWEAVVTMTTGKLLKKVKTYQY